MQELLENARIFEKLFHKIFFIMSIVASNIRWIRTLKGLSQEEFANEIGVKRAVVSNWELDKNGIKPKDAEKICKKFSITLDDFYNKDLSADKTEGEKIRLQKAIGKTEDQGLLFVPIGAQAGYTKLYEDPLLERDFERIYIPNSPYTGDRFRYFEVDGDSMEPTLSNGMWVIAEKVDKEFWNSINDFYIHVIVKDAQILIKRLVKIEEGKYAAISDNELYHQQEIKLQEIKELWLVKRKLDWDMVPPKKFEIKIK